MNSLSKSIAAAEVEGAFACLQRFGHLVLAVSGGPDSLALLHFIVEWKERLGAKAPHVSVATVDHGLRLESAREAQYVADCCAKLSVPHAVLNWCGAKPLSGIPNAARQARYELLKAYAEAASSSDPVAIVTAHHQDDQAETVLMRLARGGGVEALAAMRVERPVDHSPRICLLRPLLEFSKARLIASLEARAVAWFEDPANSNLEYERARVRDVLRRTGLDASALAETAKRMQEASDGLGYALGLFKRTLAISRSDGISVRFDRPAFEAGPVVLRQMIIRELIGHFGGSTPTPEHSEIEALIKRISSSQSLTATLGGTQISAGNQIIELWREAGRIVAAEVLLEPGNRVLWDDRFWVSIEGREDDLALVRPLGSDGYKLIAGDLPEGPRFPPGALFGLPSFWANATLLAVPQLKVVTAAGRRRQKASFQSQPVDL